MTNVRLTHGAALALACLLSIAAAACTPTPAPNTNAPQVEAVPEATNGMQVLAVEDGSAAMAGGLMPRDIIVAIGNVDTPTGAALEAAVVAARAANAPLEVVVVRDRLLATAKIGGDLAGVVTRPWVGALELQLGFLERGDREKAQLALDAGIAENLLSPAQVLVGKLVMIPKGKTPADVSARTDLVKQLAAASTPDDLKRFANDYLLGRGYNDAALLAFETYLQQRPDDFSARLNLAVAETYVGNHAEAEREVARVEKDGVNQISPQGLQLIDQVRAWSALAKKDYPTAVSRFAAMVERQPPTTDYATYLRYLYALAKARDMEKFAAGLAKLKEAAIQLRGLDNQAYLLEAFALAEQGKRNEAAAIVARAEPVLPQPVLDFWKALPGGDEVVSTWNSLKAGPK